MPVVALHYITSWQKRACCVQAIVALLNPKTQDPAVQLQIRIKAISHFVTSTRLASFVQKPDLAEKSAKLLWNAASGLLVTPATKCALIAALQEAVAALNATKPGDPQFQVWLAHGHVLQW